MGSNVKTVLAVTFLMLGLFTGINYMVDNESENLLMWVIFFFLGALLFWLWIMREERSAEEAVEESLDAAEETLQRLEAQAAPSEAAAPKAPAPSAETPKAVEKTPVPEPKVVAKTPAPKPEPVAEKSGEPDDLTQVEGIGPKSAEILIAAGIDSFVKLAAMSEDEIVETIRNGGGRKSASMGTWAEQAKLAAAGDWDGLEKLQGQLSGGKR